MNTDVSVFYSHGKRYILLTKMSIKEKGTTDEHREKLDFSLCSLLEAEEGASTSVVQYPKN